jgi:hypothetical protein
MRRSALVAATAVATHVSALGAGFVWLDHAHLEGGAALAPPSRWLALFTHGFAGTGYYRPLMSLSLSLDALISGPLIFHVTSIVWHAAAAVMTMIAAGALGLSRRAAMLAGILFAVHPLSALVANAIAFRSEAMVAVALLALIWAHLQRRPWAAAVALAAGVLTKESAAVLGPLFIIALEVMHRVGYREALTEARRARVEARPDSDPRRLLVAEAVALVGALALRFAYAPAWRAGHEPLSFGDAVGTRLAGLAKSAAAVVLPVDRSLCDAFVVTHWWQPGSIAGLVVVVAIAWVAWRQRGPAVLLGLGVLPALQLVPVARWWSPHYLYVPLAFVAMLAAAFAERLGSRATALVLGVAAILGAVTLYDGGRYANDTALWTPEVTRQPACREGQFYLGEVERQARRWDSAAKRYEAALAPRPRVLAYVDRGAALQNLGTVRVEQGRFRDARRAFREALDGTTDERARRELTHNLAGAALRDGDAAEASALLETETARPDALRESLLLRAMALRQLGRREEAERLLARLPSNSLPAP